MVDQRQQKAPERQEISVALFQSAHGGFGDARIASSPHRYNRVFRGFDTRFPGELRFSDWITRVTYPSVLNECPSAAIMWEDDGSTPPNIPVLYIFAGLEIMILRDGSITDAGINLAAAVTGAAMHHNGTGTPNIYVAEGGTGVMQIMSVTPALTSSTGVNVDKLASISGRLYGSFSNSSRWNAIRSVPIGNNPNNITNWGGQEFVGWASTDVNAIVQVRGGPVVIKPEGVYHWNDSLAIWQNRLPQWEFMPHPDNGRGAFSLGLAAVIPLGRGGAVIYDGYTVRDFSPFGPDSTPNHDTTQQVITVIGPVQYGITGHGVAALTAVNRDARGGLGNQVRHSRAFGSNFNAKLTRRGGSDDDGATIEGLRVFKTVDNEVTFTNYTTQAGDGNTTTLIDLSSLDIAANGDFFYIGHPRPWQGARLMILPANQNDNAATLSAEVWNGTAWSAIAILDFTLGSTGTRTLHTDGIVMFTDDPINDNSWATRTIGTDDQQCYYARFRVSALLDANTQIAEVFLLPWRPPIDSTNFPLDSMDRAGCFPHLLLGDLNERGNGAWHDLGAIITDKESPDDAQIVTTMAAAGGTYGNTLDKLIILGRRNAYSIDSTINEYWPFIHSQGLFESAMLIPDQGRRVVQLKEITVEGRDMNGVSQIFFYYRYGENEPWASVRLGTSLPAVVPRNDEQGMGVTFQYAIGYTMTLDTVARRPAITGVNCKFDVLSVPPNQVPQRPIANPPRG